ncbi:MAG: acetyl-CoA carboxylase biotin carboxyl carrier protein [Methylovirgula sp.]
MTEKKPGIPAPPTPIDPQLVETLGEIANRLDLSEIEVAQGELKIKVKRQSANAAPVAVAVPALSTLQAHALAPAANEAALAIAANAVKSPMVGTAYLRPSPESAPFITIGTQVKAGEKLLLIEAMKTFNEIVAPQAGTVTSILVEDGQPVEFGQPLVVVE